MTTQDMKLRNTISKCIEVYDLVPRSSEFVDCDQILGLD